MNRVDLIVGEGATEILIAQRLLDLEGVSRTHARQLDKGGQTAFWRDLHRYASAAQAGYNVFALVDLEAAECPGALVTKRLPIPRPPSLCLRVAVRASESWLLADVEGISNWLRIAQSLVPRSPETLASPKRELVRLAARSPIRKLRESLIPEPQSSGIVGREYLVMIAEFVRTKWNPTRAARVSDSLQRALSAIRSAP